MALSKDRTLDRLEHISKSFGSKGEDCFDEYVVEAADSAIALINSTDFAEVEKLRARVLELEAENQKLLENGNSRLVGFATLKDGETRFFREAPKYDATRGFWLSEDGSEPPDGPIRERLSPRGCHPIYIGRSLDM